MSDGNKHDNGVHEVGTPETLQAYQEDTPGQEVEKYLAGIQEVIQEKKEKQKKSFMQVFQNPLKGFPYNEELDDNFVKPIKEESLEEAKNLMPDIQKIVDTKGAAKVGGVMLDMFTASVITQAYAKVNDSNKKKMENSNIQTLVKLAQRLMGMKEGKISDLLIDIQQGATAKELAKDWKIPLSVAKDFLKDYYGSKPKRKKEEVEEGYRDIIKMYPRDNDWKKLITKHKKHLDDFQNGKKDLDTKVEDELITWALDNGEISNKGEVEDFIDQVLNASYEPQGDSLKEESVDLQEGTWEVPDSYPKLVKLNKFLSQNANFKDAQSVHRWHVQADAYFGDDSFSDDIDAYKTTLKGGERSFYDRGALHGKEYLDRAKKYNKIKAGTDLRDVLEKQLSDWTGGVLKFKNHEIVQMPRDWYMKDNPNEKDDKSPVKAKLESVDYHTKVIVEKFKRGKGSLKFKKSPPIKVEGNKVVEKKMDGSKLTGQEISVYFRRNKVRDKMTKKAVEIALDHGGAMNYAIKQIEKLKRGLSKNKDVQKALNYANFGEQVRIKEVGFMFKEDSPVAGNIQLEGDPYIPQKKGVNKNIAKYWKKEIKGISQKELEAVQSMYMITDHSGVVQMYKAGKRAFIKSLKD